MEAFITNIQRFSLNDGPGIRTTVFFQGCNMRCAWCHNPETLPVHPVLMHYENKCIGCGHCFSVCPQGAHKIVGERHVVDRELCTDCGRCAAECFSGALAMSARAYTVEEVMAEIIQDKIYYRESGGGVTLSGGEVTMNVPFAAGLAEACGRENIDVAVETNMLMDLDQMMPLLEKVSLIMCDIKHFDSDEHEKWVGVSNKKVLDNIRKASSLGIPMIVRTPLIPGATDSAENINAIAEFLSGLQNIRFYELLNFNPLGGSKYVALDADDRFSGCRPFTQRELSAFRSKLAAAGKPALKIS